MFVMHIGKRVFWLDDLRGDSGRSWPFLEFPFLFLDLYQGRRFPHAGSGKFFEGDLVLGVNRVGHKGFSARALGLGLGHFIRAWGKGTGDRKWMALCLGGRIPDCPADFHL